MISMLWPQLFDVSVVHMAMAVGDCRRADLNDQQGANQLVTINTLWKLTLSVTDAEPLC